VQSLSSNLQYYVAYFVVFTLWMMRIFGPAVILLSAPYDFMGVGQQTSQGFTRNRTNKHEFRLERLWWIILDVILEVYFWFFIQREVDQWMKHSNHRCGQSLVQSPQAFIFPNHAHCLEHVVRVLCLVISFSDWAKNLCLHSSADEPKGVCYYVASDSSNARRDWVQLEWILLPL